MWIFRKRRHFISLETLSEYLDGRLAAVENQQVERHLEVCLRCREELESLEYTVGLLRRVPTVAPRRVFTLGEAPTVVSPHRGGRVPTWAYGTAASVAVMLFALVLSTDLSGLLAEPVSAPEVSRPTAGAAIPATPSPEPTAVLEITEEAGVGLAPPPQEPPSQDGAAATLDTVSAKAAPAPTPSPQAAAMAKEPDVTPPIVPAEEVVVSRAVESDAQMEMAAPAISTPEPQVVAPTVEAGAPAAAVSMAQQERTKSEGVTAPAAPATPLPTVPPLPSPRPDTYVQDATPTLPSVAPTPTPGPTPYPVVTTPVRPPEEGDVKEGPPTKPTGGGTATVWHVLEGLLGGVALLLVAGVLWRVRHNWRRTST